MKKLIATLFVATLGFSFVAMAASKPVYTLKPAGYQDSFPILEAVLPIQYGSDYITYRASTDLTMTYTVQGSINRILENNDGTLYSGLDKNKDDPDYKPSGRTNFDLALVSFHTNQDTYLAIFPNVEHVATPEPRIDLSLNITDYGIYFLDDPTNYLSMMGQGVDVEANREFGVYYRAETTYTNSSYNRTNPELLGTTVETLITTTDNWVASYDNANKNEQLNENNHTLDNAWFSDTKIKTGEAFFCLFQGPYTADNPAYLEWDHFEFGFASGEKASGQPLPGTLATLLIGGLCAGALRKRNKK